MNRSWNASLSSTHREMETSGPSSKYNLMLLTIYMLSGLAVISKLKMTIEFTAALILFKISPGSPTLGNLPELLLSRNLRQHFSHF